jgi:hypothetical protein
VLPGVIRKLVIIAEPGLHPVDKRSPQHGRHMHDLFIAGGMMHVY